MAAEATKTRINLKKNDTVQVIAGRDAGKQGKILKVIPEKNRVVVQGVAFVKRHTSCSMPGVPRKKSGTERSCRYSVGSRRSHR